jgi:hypothetical protein
MQKSKKRSKPGQQQTRFSDGDPNDSNPEDFEEEFEAVSAPTQNRNLTHQHFSNDKYQTGQFTIDSLTDLSSPSQTSSNHTMKR